MEIRISAMVITGVRRVNWMAHGIGRRSAISRSNKRKVIATRKNFIENGKRAVPIGSNPHSYGLTFSIYTFICGIRKAMRIRVSDIRVLNIIVIIRFITPFRYFRNYLIGSQMYLLILKEYDPHQ